MLHKSKLQLLQERVKALETSFNLFGIILNNLDFDKMVQKIADLIPQYLHYETGVLALIDEKKGILRRTAISRTSGGLAALKSLEIDFKKIDIPLDCKENYCIKAIKTGKQQITHNLYDVVRPAISRENSELVQKMMGTKISVVNPIFVGGKPIGIFIVSMSKEINKISFYEREMINKFVEGVGVALQNSQLYKEVKDKTSKLKRANLQLKKLDKQKDEFISIASHELKTPITILKTNLWMLQRSLGKSLKSKDKYFLEESQKGLERLSKIVNNLLDISRIEQGRFVLDLQPYNLDLVIKESLDYFKDQAKQAGLKLVYPKKKIGEVVFDKDRFREVLDNYLSNAIKYTKRGGVRVNVFNEGNYLKITVADTGPGIKKSDIKKLFKKFSRATEGLKQVTPGASTGLGLYISKRIVEEWGGKVGVVSQQGRGSVFWFTLPKKT